LIIVAQGANKRERNVRKLRKDGSLWRWEEVGFEKGARGERDGEV